jgi:stage V sporulation protein R
MLEILRNHANVVLQPGFDDPRFSGINPYALGLDMMRDIQRIATAPTAEDRDWFPEIAGAGDWRAILLEAWANHRDESFIRQYLSPALIRKWRMFVLSDAANERCYNVASIHNERGYEQIRSALARRYDIGASHADIQVVDVDLLGQRHLRLQHMINDGILLENDSCDATLRHIQTLWGYDVSLRGVDAQTGATVYERSGRQSTR